MVSGILATIFTIALLAMLGLGGFFIYKRATVSVDYDVDYSMSSEERGKIKAEAKDKTSKLKKKYLGLVTLFGVLAAAFLTLDIIVPGSIHQVDTGQVAVVRHLGKIEGVRQDGIHWDFYLTNNYTIYDTKVQQIDMETQAYTFDKQTVGLNFSMQYQIDAANVDSMARIYGDTDKVESKIEKVALDKIKAIFAKNTADNIIEDRSTILAEVKSEVDSAINAETYYLVVKDIVLTNVDFTDDYEAAVAAKVAQQQAYEKAVIEQKQALAQAENDKAIAIAKAQAEAESAKLEAEAAAQVAKIKAEADMEVAKIAADTAEYAGRKEAAISLNKLAGVNGWYVVNLVDEKGNTTGYKLMKNDGTEVTEAELAVGVDKLIEVLKYEKWDGALPQYQMGSNGTIAVVTPTP